MTLSSLTIKKKLFLSYGMMIAVLAILGAVSILKVLDLSSEIHSLGITDATKNYQAGVVNGATSEMVADMRGILLEAVLKNNDLVKKGIASYSQHEALIHKSMDGMKALGVSPEGMPWLNHVNGALDKTAPIYSRYLSLIQHHDLKAADQLRQKELRPALEEVSDAGAALLERQRTHGKTSSDAVQLRSIQSLWTISALLIFSALIGVVVIWIVRQLDADLRRNVLELSEGSNQVSSAAAQISGSSQSMARETSEQAAMIEETSASAEEINSMAKRNAENAHGATELVAEAVKSSDFANRAVADCVLSMEAIGNSSEQISKIIEVIDKIAFQTNILALNAAVEAARAGQAGLGFAVVADEVRNLAQRCAQAAQDTAVLIKQSVTNTSEGRTRMKVVVDSGEKVNSVFTRIKVLIDEIGVSSQEQGRGIEQIGRAISKMEQGTQKGAATAEETAAAAEQLNAQSDALRQVAGQLGTMVGVHEPERQASRPGFAASAVHSPKPSAKAAKGSTAGLPAFVKAFQAPKPAAVTNASSFSMDGDFTEF